MLHLAEGGAGMGRGFNLPSGQLTSGFKCQVQPGRHMTPAHRERKFKEPDADSALPTCADHSLLGRLGSNCISGFFIPPALAQLPSALTSQLSLSLETQFQHHLPARPSLTLDLLESYSVVVSD